MISLKAEEIFFFVVYGFSEVIAHFKYYIELLEDIYSKQFQIEVILLSM